MFGETFKRQVSGEEIEASTINAPLDAIEAFGKLRTGTGLSMQQGPGGVAVIRRVAPETQEARITGGGTGGKYSWRGIYDAASGTWTDDDSKVAGTTSIDPCWESNGYTGVTVGTRVRMTRGEATGEWRFDADNCP